MKKLYMLALGAMIGGTFNAQTYLTKDFDDNSVTSGGWTTQMVIGTYNWATSTAGGAATPYAMMTSYNSVNMSNDQTEVWLISPPVDLVGSASVTPTLSFQNAANFQGPDMEILVSADYDGSNLGSATWTNGTYDMSCGGFAFIPSGNIDLSAYNNEDSLYIAFKYTSVSGNNGGKVWEVDDILINETGGATTQATSIYGIQYTTLPSGESPLMDQRVSTGGIVTHVKLDGSSQQAGYYIQSGSGGWNGIYVFDDWNTVAVGDSVTFTAGVTEFSNLTELVDLCDFSKDSIFIPVVPESISTSATVDEQWEGVLVEVGCAICITEEDGFGIWTANDGSGAANIDKEFFDASESQGETYSITGILDGIFVGGTFNNVYRIQPRNANDVAVVNCTGSTAINEYDVSFDLYPNPVHNQLNVAITGTHLLSILDVTGKVVATQTINGFTSMDVSSLVTGVYVVKIDTTTQKLIVE